MVEEFLFEQNSRHFAQPQTFQMDKLLNEVQRLDHPPFFQSMNVSYEIYCLWFLEQNFFYLKLKFGLKNKSVNMLVARFALYLSA